MEILAHIIVTLVAVGGSTLVTWKIAKRQIAARFDLLEKEHDIYKTRKLWDLQFQFFQELSDHFSYSVTAKVAAKDWGMYEHEALTLMMKSRVLFHDKQIHESLTDEWNNVHAFNQGEIDTKGFVTTSIQRVPAALKRVSKILGFID